MTISEIRTISTWRDVANGARTTIGLGDKEGEVSDTWVRKILRAEHSPIRQRLYVWTWHDIPYWVSVHFVRHKVGIEHFVKTSRSDRTGIDRKSLQQDSPVDHKCMANAQALIAISRKRLCFQASAETRAAWKMLVDEMTTIDKAMADAMVAECVYRGFCPEMKSCGFAATDCFKQQRKEYTADY